MTDLESAVSGRDVFRQHVHAAHEIFGIRRKSFAQQFRIGEYEIRRRDRIGDLSDVKFRLLAGMLVNVRGVFDQPLGPLDGQQISLLEEIEKLVLRPFRVGEAFVSGIGSDHRISLLAGHSFDGSRPQIKVSTAKRGL